MALKLKSDSAGFLIGDPIDIGHAVDHLRGIKNDVAAIRQAVIKGSAGNNRSQGTQPATARIAAAVPAGRQSATGLKSTQAVVVATRGRDSSGRFTSTGAAVNSRNQPSGIVLPLNRAGRFVVAGTDGVANADPTVKAFKEVAEPMQRGYSALFGGGDKKERWFRRIFGELKLFRKEETAYQKAANKALKNIENKKEVGGTATNTSTSIWNKIPVISPMIRGIGRGVGNIGKGILGAGKGLFRRIPILGALLAAGGAISDIYGYESDDSLSSLDKYKGIGKASGGLAGTFGGMFAGAAAGSLAGPIGTVVGGVVGAFLGDQAGQVIGEKFGEWTNDLREADIPGKIIGVWDSAVKIFSDAWRKTKEIGSKAVDIAVEQIDGLNTYIDKNTGINPQELGKAWWDRTNSNLSEALSGVKKGIDWVGDNTTIGKGVKELVRSEGLSRVLRRDDGSLETRQGGSRAWRNNNPGNLRYGNFAKSMGAVGADADGYAVFGDADSGRAARAKLLFESQGGKKLKTNADYGAGLGYQDKTLLQAVAAYVPPEDSNDTAAYQKLVLSAAGGVNKRMGDYSPVERQAILGAFEKREGFRQGSVTVANSAVRLPAATVSAPSGAKPILPMTTSYSEAPPTITPLGTVVQDRPITVNLPSQDVGQDIGDRDIAHIATGGISRRPW